MGELHYYFLDFKIIITVRIVMGDLAIRMKKWNSMFYARRLRGNDEKVNFIRNLQRNERPSRTDHN